MVGRSIIVKKRDVTICKLYPISCVVKCAYDDAYNIHLFSLSNIFFSRITFTLIEFSLQVYASSMAHRGRNAVMRVVTI